MSGSAMFTIDDHEHGRGLVRMTADGAAM